MAKAIFLSHQRRNIEMLLFIILVVLVILTKSLIALLATDSGFSFDASVAIAGLVSYIGLAGYIFGTRGRSGKSFDWFRRGASVAEGHFEATDHLQQDIAALPAGRQTAGSSLVRRLVRAKDDPAKQRIRAQLSAIDDERLSCLGLTSEDIAALRGTASPPAEATIALQISPPIARSLDATDAVSASDPPRRERVLMTGGEAEV
jgi:hypothetical protein